MTEDDLQTRLAGLVAEHDLAGAALGVLAAGEVTAVAAGVVNRRTGVEATPDTVFQIGSQGKMSTATVLMQLVDEGLVDLDAPVCGPTSRPSPTSVGATTASPGTSTRASNWGRPTRSAPRCRTATPASRSSAG
jgi:CubicO group peptidase (beta-lactamase class C family)